MLLRGLAYTVRQTSGMSVPYVAPLDLNLDHSPVHRTGLTIGEQPGNGESSPKDEPVVIRHRINSLINF